MVLCEYVWLDAEQGFRSKTRVLDQMINSVSDVPEWNYDGSSTGQATCGELTEVMLKPVAMFNDPFRIDHFKDSKLIWCETYRNDNTYSSSRELAVKSFEQNKENEPWFGIEQEYYLTHFDPSHNIAPYGMYTIDHAKTQNDFPYYCKPTNHAFGQNIAEEHLIKCIRAGIKMSGINAEVGPSQWEYQVGPCVGIESGDQLMISRYILERVADIHNANVDWTPRPFDGWNGSGCHTNFSTKLMREGDHSGDGMTHIMKSISNLEKTHAEDVTKMGIGNDLRLTGYNETASEDVFTFGEGTRHTSIRIGTETAKLRKGYFEDRRPGSNMDPYVVTKILNDSTLY